MKINQLIVCLLAIPLVIGLFNCSPDETKTEARKTFMLGGIQVNSPDQNEWMTVLNDAVMNTVSITVYTRHYDWSKSFFTIDSSSFANVIHEIETAKANHMKVVFIPRVMLDHYFEENRFLWHGMILPQTDSLIQQWFTFYTDYVNEWAKICEKYEVEVFAIGSEYRAFTQTQPIQSIPKLEAYYLNKKQQQEYINDRITYKNDIPPDQLWIGGNLVNYDNLEHYLKDEVAAYEAWAKRITFNGDIDKMNARRALLLENWLALIETVRKSYSGKLTYAANFDNYQNIAFWDKLDYMGINAYFPLRNNFAPVTIDEKYAEMEDSWNRIFKDIVAFQNRNNIKRPLFFTELGYTTKENCTLMPWQGAGFAIHKTNFRKDLIIWNQQPNDFRERAAAIKALRVINQKYNNMLEGILYWKLSDRIDHQRQEPFLMLLGSEKMDPMHFELLEFLEQ